MTVTYQMVETPAGSGVGYEPRGAALALWKCKAPEVVLAGPAQTGKTYGCCQKLNALLWKYSGSQAVMVRHEYKTLIPTVYQTYRKVLGPDSPVKAHGGEHPQWLDYPNGSRLWLAGLDNPGKALSSDRDFVYVNQAEEIDLEAWGVLCSRATGRAGNSPYPQVMGDCNPGPPWHWVKGREREGRLVVLESRHEDNPTLFDKGQWTALGVQTLATLDALPGVLRDRLRYGRWVAAEGVVYPGWDARLHLIDPFPVPPSWRRVRSVDFGWTNPFACLWLAADGDGRLYLYREIYHTRRTVREHATQINALSAGESIEATVADHDAEDRATLLVAGIGTVPALKEIGVGIQAVGSRLAPAGDGRPRLFVFRNALVERDESLVAGRKPVCTAEEMQVYSWPKGADGRPVKEVPLDLHNHGLDALRYAVRYVDGSPGFTRASVGAGGGRVNAMPAGVFGRRGGGAGRMPPGVFGR